MSYSDTWNACISQQSDFPPIRIAPDDADQPVSDITIRNIIKNASPRDLVEAENPYYHTMCTRVSELRNECRLLVGHLEKYNDICIQLEERCKTLWKAYQTLAKHITPVANVADGHEALTFEGLEDLGRGGG